MSDYGLVRLDVNTNRENKEEGAYVNVKGRRIENNVDSVF